MPVRFVHTNIIANDWRRLASFYETVLGCLPVSPERDLSGDWLSEATAIRDARISGIHMRLPGYDENGPTLEIFQYGSMPSRPEILLNTPGFSHIAFAVDDVSSMAEAVRNGGGRDVGKLTEIEIPGIGFLVFQYVADPEGNIIELQKWMRRGHEVT